MFSFSKIRLFDNAGLSCGLLVSVDKKEVTKMLIVCSMSGTELHARFILSRFQAIPAL